MSNYDSTYCEKFSQSLQNHFSMFHFSQMDCSDLVNFLVEPNPFDEVTAQTNFSKLKDPDVYAAHLARAFQALTDVMDMKPEELSMSGKLGIKFGCSEEHMKNYSVRCQEDLKCIGSGLDSKIDNDRTLDHATVILMHSTDGTLAHAFAHAIDLFSRCEERGDGKLTVLTDDNLDSEHSPALTCWLGYPRRYEDHCQQADKIYRKLNGQKYQYVSDAYEMYARNFMEYVDGVAADIPSKVGGGVGASFFLSGKHGDNVLLPTMYGKDLDDIYRYTQPALAAMRNRGIMRVETKPSLDSVLERADQKELLRRNRSRPKASEYTR